MRLLEIDTIITGNNIVAPAAAYRSKRQWYTLRFDCTVAPDYKSVSDFSFQTGGLIPKSQWADHNLTAADSEE